MPSSTRHQPTLKRSSKSTLISLGRKCPVPPPHPPEFRRRAVELARTGDGPVTASASSLGISQSCLSGWLRQADVDDGRVEGLSGGEKKELAELRGKARQLSGRTKCSSGPRSISRARTCSQNEMLLRPHRTRSRRDQRPLTLPVNRLSILRPKPLLAAVRRFRPGRSHRSDLVGVRLVASDDTDVPQHDGRQARERQDADGGDQHRDVQP
ncbi:transposase [Actinomadura sp. J1-007]|nr:transposase [Actinomadura sp. J1-007]